MSNNNNNNNNKDEEEEGEEEMKSTRPGSKMVSPTAAIVVGLVAGLVAWTAKGWKEESKGRIGPKDPSLFWGLHGLKEEYDLVIVGAGLSGAVVAEQASSRLGLSSLVIDKRDHIR